MHLVLFVIGIIPIIILVGLYYAYSKRQNMSPSQHDNPDQNKKRSFTMEKLNYKLKIKITLGIAFLMFLIGISSSIYLIH